MEDSKPFSEVVELGRLIVRQLGLEETQDTLSRWLAHRIAEVMTAAEEASDARERAELGEECEELILRVWERRSNWPHGWPPAEAAEALDRLMPTHGVFRNQGALEPVTWLDALPRLEEMQAREVRLVLRAGLLDSPASEAEEWLEDAEAHLDSDEVNVLERLRELKTEADLTGESPEARARLVVEALDELAVERQRLFAGVVNNLSPKPRKAARKRPQPPGRS